MTIIKFSIIGNQEDRFANPIPYTRMTQKTKWLPKSIRYFKWKEYVRGFYRDAAMKIPEIDRFDLLRDKPIPATKDKSKMSLMIYFCNKTHGDCDNIYKGIADALFVNDKYLSCGGIDYDYSVRPRVEVIIEI